MKRLIEDLIDLKTGEQLSAGDILNQAEDKIHLLRRELKEAQLSLKKGDDSLTSIACALCYQPVVIVGTQQQEYFFKHGYESGDCPIKTLGKYSQEEINRMKYNGAKESIRHIDLKSAISSALQGKNSACTDVQQERRITSRGLSKNWRKPDVQARCEEKQLAFELQLSTTFLDVIVEREKFYQSEKIFMLWVFDGFTESGSRFTEKDIYYPNNRNAYAITDETRQRSRERRELVLMCHYQKPLIDSGAIVKQWMTREVTLSDLTFDKSTWRAYYFDYEKEEAQLAKQLKQQEPESFEEYWEVRQSLSDSERHERDKHYFVRLKAEGLIPDSYTDEISFPLELEQILNDLFCVKKGKMFAYKYSKWIQLANQVLEYRPHFARIFVEALRTYGFHKEIIDSDKKGVFRGKYDRIIKGSKNGDPEYEQNLEFRPLFKRLFLELYTHKRVDWSEKRTPTRGSATGSRPNRC
uniref:Competence protein CoiA-like family protein n=1 Tax=Candidatus Kentrum sp. LPFa TaxID=2126335 RepID=A0A450W5X5_9GAMM|nr:MAG: hypothetical protein BECKLPF1236B_GA0070989_103519 [Candidatus Kentron sp. LPFa]